MANMVIKSRIDSTLQEQAPLRSPCATGPQETAGLIDCSMRLKSGAVMLASSEAATADSGRAESISSSFANQTTVNVMVGALLECLRRSGSGASSDEQWRQPKRHSRSSSTRPPTRLAVNSGPLAVDFVTGWLILTAPVGMLVQGGADRRLHDATLLTILGLVHSQ